MHIPEGGGESSKTCSFPRGARIELRMNRRNFLHTTLSAAAAAQSAAPRPNILLFCTDQQRFDTIRALGNGHLATIA